MAETMKGKGKFYILDESIIPEAILKTAKVKEHLAKHRNMTVNEAVEEILAKKNKKKSKLNWKKNKTICFKCTLIK